MNVMGMVQLVEADAGGEEYSRWLGIEAAAGRVRSGAELMTVMHGALREAIGPAEGVASGIAFRVARRGSFEELPDLCAALTADRLPVAMRKAALRGGERLWMQSRRWEWAAPIHQQVDGLPTAGVLPHAVAFGTLVSETTASQVRAIAMCLFNVAKAIVGVAGRRIPLEELELQRVLSGLQPVIAEIAAGAADRAMEF